MTREVGVGEAARRRADYTAVDVREAHEFEGPLGHLPGAVLRPLGQLPGSLEGTPRDARLLLVCRSGKRSLRACELLAEAGFPDVTNLEGGMIAWNEAGLPVDRRPPQSLPEVIENVIAYLSQVTSRPPEAVQGMLEQRLEAAGSSYEAPSSAALEWALQELAESLGPAVPADLDLALAAWRRDLAVL